MKRSRFDAEDSPQLEMTPVNWIPDRLRKHSAVRIELFANSSASRSRAAISAATDANGSR